MALKCFKLFLISVILASCSWEDKDNIYRVPVPDDYLDTCSGTYFKKVFHVSPRMQGQLLGPNYFFMEHAWATMADTTGAIIWTWPYNLEYANRLICNNGFIFLDGKKIKKITFERTSAFEVEVSDPGMVEFKNVTDDGGLIYRYGNSINKVTDGNQSVVIHNLVNSSDLKSIYQSGISDELIFAETFGDTLFLKKYRNSIPLFLVKVVEGKLEWCKVIEGKDRNTLLIRKLYDEQGFYFETYDPYGVLKQSVFYSLLEMPAPRLFLKSKDGTVYMAGQVTVSVKKGHYQTYNIQTILSRVSESGNIFWRKEFGGLTDDYPLNVQDLEGGDILLLMNSAGYTGSDIKEFFKASVIKMDANGNTCY